MTVGACNGGRRWSWAASAADADARRREAGEVVGQRIRDIRYFELDYRRDQHPALMDGGPREVHSEWEWDEPTWLYEGFDAVDFGLELTTERRDTFSLTWDPPGEHEGIGLQRVPMLGSGVGCDANVAIWTVSDRAVSWAAMVGRVVTAVELHYVPWDRRAGSLWCPRITFHGEHGRVEIVMGDAENGVMVPSADTVAVLHPGTALPAHCV